MTNELSATTQQMKLGWRELGRYFVIIGVVGMPIGLLSRGLTMLALPTMLEMRENLQLFFTTRSLIENTPPIFALLAGLAFALRGFSQPWRTLGFVRTDASWFVAAIGGWVFVVGVFGHVLSALGQDLFGADAMFGRPSVIYAPPNPSVSSQPSVLLALGIVISHASLAAASELAHRGFLYSALRNAWTYWPSALAASLLSTLVFFAATPKLGIVPVFTMWFIGSLLNCFLLASSKSILPGLLGIVCAAVYVGGPVSM